MFQFNDFNIFRELLLSHNHLRVLPYELGKLFQLHVLGLQGNPLNKEILSLYGETNGTHKLLTYMLDSLQGKKKNHLDCSLANDLYGLLAATIPIKWNDFF